MKREIGIRKKSGFDTPFGSAIGISGESIHLNPAITCKGVMSPHRQISNLIDFLVDEMCKTLLPPNWNTFAAAEKYVLLEDLAKSHLNVSFGNCASAYGVAYWSAPSGGFKILVNRKYSARQQLFSLAHEIGHVLVHLPFYAKQELRYPYCLQHPLTYLRRLPLGTVEDEEREADYFALRLLQKRANYSFTLTQAHAPPQATSAAVPKCKRKAVGKSCQ